MQMQDVVMSTKLDPISERALKIYCATKDIDKKDAVAQALKKEIPTSFFEMAGVEIRRETADSDE